VFDFSLGEMLVVGTVALVVIGPERLPKVARTLGAMLARAQRYVNAVKTDIQREVELQNLKQIEAEMNEAGRKLMDELKGGVDDMHSTLNETAKEVTSAFAAPSRPTLPPDALASVGQAPATEAATATLERPEPAAPATPPERDRR
jgi:sec-independent protein translocase protein TatB